MIGGMDDDHNRWSWLTTDGEVIITVAWTLVLMSPLFCILLFILPMAALGAIPAAVVVFFVVRYVNRRHDPRRQKPPPKDP